MHRSYFYEINTIREQPRGAKVILKKNVGGVTSSELSSSSVSWRRYLWVRNRLIYRVTSFHFENSYHSIHVYCMIIIIGALYAFIMMQVSS